jgi:fumarate reductase flavoprotein subunit
LHVGADIVKVLTRECQSLRVEFVFDTQAAGLLTDTSGRVTGAAAVTNGHEVEFKAKAVIIATGGYGGNREMLAQYVPGYTNSLPTSGIEISHTGDGIRMAFEAGADDEGLGNLLMCGPCFVGGFGIFHLAIEPTTIWVNKNGRRFIEEGLGCSPFEAPNAMLRQPEQVCFSIFDERTVRQVLEHGYIRPDADTVSPVDKIEAAMKEHVAKGTLKTASTAAGLAESIGLDKDALTETINRYNGFCDAGHDSEFAKNPDYLKALRQPPFYAAKCYPWHLGSIGGIKINERMEVLDKDHRPIIGLFAVGSDTGGWSSATYNRYLAGAGASYAINSGFIGGENAVKYLKT